MLTIFNSLSRKKEVFVPLTPQKIGLYVCGMTVYDFCHIGHARIFVVFDMVVRYLRSLGFDVTYIRNITDIDDKIIRRAAEQHISINELTDRYIREMHADEKALGIERPTQEPRATQHINHMIALTQTLLQKEHAYISESGDVCYRVHSFSDYGKLSHKDIEGLRSGERVEVTREKEDPLDFVLWKLAKPGEPAWKSPWGAGRPGWHIECSAMAENTLGETFDLHGGGADLQFPHHENEIAQSEAAHGKPFAKTWMHVGFVEINSEKMSKSLNNFFTIREVLEQHDPEVIRYFLLSSHYRSPLNYTETALHNAHQALERFYISLRDIPINDKKMTMDSDYQQRFVNAMNDDFNTPEALAVLFDCARELNRYKSEDINKAKILAHTLTSLAALLGLLQQNPNDFLQQKQTTENTHQWINDAIQARLDARANKNWSEADNIRQTLLEKGIVLEDTANGTTWRAL